MHLSEGQIQRLKDIEIDILKHFIEVCDRLQLQYFVVQGTLLGAVRHQGFIPWDDDIDVGMLREDYDVFLEKGQDLLPDGYFIQTSETDPGYPHGFAKIRNTSTAFVETTCRTLPMNHGIFIDVFPFDYYPEKIRDRGMLCLKKLLLRYRIRCELYIPADHRISAANLARFCLKKVSKVIYPSYETAVYEQCRLYSYQKPGRFRINHGSPWGKKECIPSDWIEHVTPLRFEGIQVNAPVYYKEYLSHVYGDFMKLPPPQKRVPHHYITYIDFAGPYIVEKSQERGYMQNHGMN